MLGELAITPDVYLETSFTDAAAAAVAWERLRDPVMHECLLRDLFDGQMSRVLLDPSYTLSPKGKELLRKFVRRSRQVPRVAEDLPQTDMEWCAEAIASAKALPMDCIVTTESTKKTYNAEALVSDAEKIGNHPWWVKRASSVRLDRKIDDYLRVLDKVLVASNSLMFIDPYLDPTRPQYSDFWRILARCHRSEAPVHVEIHRVCSEGSGSNKRAMGLAELKRRFSDGLLPKLSGLNLKLKLVVWPEFHDRYLISDLIGISLPNGFDVNNKPNDMTTWTRLGRADRDDVQREFDWNTCLKDVNRGVVELLP